MIKTAKEKSKNILCFYCSERMCERSYKGKNVAVLCPMSGSNKFVKNHKKSYHNGSGCGDKDKSKHE